jgi:uncharacterized membrane protein (UPF0127 family)
MRTSRTALLVLSVLVGVAGCAGKAERVQLTVGSGVFRVEVARTDAQRELGLMHRRTIGAREGMLFVFDSDQHLSFWMKDTLVHLSIAFLSSEGRILQIEDMEPLSLRAIHSQLSVRYALELPRGAYAEVGAAVGDSIRLPEGLR